MGKKGLKMDLKNTGVQLSRPGCHFGDVGSTGGWGCAPWPSPTFSPSLGGGFPREAGILIFLLQGSGDFLIEAKGAELPHLPFPVERH